MNIIVLCGGMSTERDVSLISGKKAAEALRRLDHKTVLVDLFFGYPHPYNDPHEIFDHNFSDDIDATINDVPDLDALMAKRGGDNRSRIGSNIIEICSAADIVFLALHGNDGEDGKIQAMFELYGIKYTGCDSLGSAMAMNKGVAKTIFLQNGISTPTGITVNKNDNEYKTPGFPCVVKPRSGGSSVGTSIVGSEKEYADALALAFKYEDDVLVENYIKGREFSVGVINGKALPVIEIVPRAGFFDYKNKYLDNMTDEYCPAHISESAAKQLQRAAEAVFEALMLKVYARIDFILDESGREWCLEANTLPGLTPSSLMPKEAAAAGIPYDDFCALIIEKSLEKYNG